MLANLYPECYNKFQIEKERRSFQQKGVEVLPPFGTNFDSSFSGVLPEGSKFFGARVPHSLSQILRRFLSYLQIFSVNGRVFVRKEQARIIYHTILLPGDREYAKEKGKPRAF